MTEKEDRTGMRTRATDSQGWLQQNGILVIIVLNIIILSIAVFAQKLANDRYADDISNTERRAEANRQVVLFVCEQLEEHRLFSNAHGELAATAHRQVYPPADLPPRTINGGDRCKQFRAESDQRAKEEKK